MPDNTEYLFLNTAKTHVLFFESVFRREILDKSTRYAHHVREKEGNAYGVGSLSATIWLGVLFEIENAFNDLMQESLERIAFNQRRTYFSVRFAMEATADLLYLEKHPEELEKVITGKDFYKELRRLNEINDSVRKDKKVSDALRHENEFSINTERRIKEYFEGGGLTKYSILCLFTHNNDLGNEFFSRKNEKEYLEYYYQILDTLTMVLEKLVQYMLRHKEFDASKDCLNKLVESMRALVGALYEYVKPDLKNIE